MDKEARHILSISGGKDSAALAVHMMHTRNIPNMEYVFMDTEKELDETYEFLEKLEGILGVEITRLKPERSFDDLLRLHGNFLPSAQARWCTVMLKIKPFEKYVGNDKVYSYIGIRSDENRDGFQISAESNIMPVYPFKEDGITKRDVYQILEDSGLGIPTYYKWRSRSGCFFCFFQQKIEWLGLKENHPTLFEEAKNYEKDDEVTGNKFKWTEAGTLDEIVKNPAKIRLEHQKALDRKKPKRSRLMDVMRLHDPFEEADAFDAVMKDEEDGEGCLICTL